MMSKDQWIAEYERIMDDFHDGEASLSETGERLESLGIDPHEIREMLSEEVSYPIPKGYFGKEKEASK